jgi:hypothetical protein
MIQQVNGEILFKNIERNPRLREYVETRIQRWVSEHEAIWDRIFFLVSFHRKRDIKLTERRVVCHIELVGNNFVWIANEEGRRPKNAFLRSLMQLEPAVAASGRRL